MWFVLRTKDRPDRQQNILLSDSAPIIGDNAQILSLGGDVDADGNPEGLLAQPVQGGATGQVAKWVVMQRHGRKSRTLLLANDRSFLAYTPQGFPVPLLPGGTVQAPHGYVFVFDSAQTNLGTLRVALADSGGQPASDVLTLQWNADSARYVLLLP